MPREGVGSDRTRDRTATGPSEFAQHYPGCAGTVTDRRRESHNPKVVGSNPTSATMISNTRGRHRGALSRCQARGLLLTRLGSLRQRSWRV